MHTKYVYHINADLYTNKRILYIYGCVWKYMYVCKIESLSKLKVNENNELRMRSKWYKTKKKLKKENNI